MASCLLSFPDVLFLVFIVVYCLAWCRFVISSLAQGKVKVSAFKVSPCFLQFPAVSFSFSDTLVGCFILEVWTLSFVRILGSIRIRFVWRLPGHVARAIS